MGHWGWTLFGVYSISSVYGMLSIGCLCHFTAFVAFNTIKSYLMQLTTRSYGLGCFWHSLVACWLSVALLRDYVCVCSVYHCS